MFPFPAKRGPLGRGLLSAVCPADSGKDNARQNTDYTGNQQRAVRVSGYENDAQEKQKYTDRGMYRGELKDISFEMDMVGMKQNRYQADIYYKTLQVSYTMTLSRPGSDTKKIITGKLLKNYPYDCSPIRHEVSDLPPEDA